MINEEELKEAIKSKPKKDFSLKNSNEKAEEYLLKTKDRFSGSLSQLNKIFTI
jgi:hypothetical protein